MDAPSQRAATTIDPKLMLRVVKGDLQAFSQLYDQSSILLYSLALRILGNREEAAELLQEVYLQVWRKVARYDVGHGTPIAWLITLTRSRAVDRLRARGISAPRQREESIREPTVGHAPDQNEELPQPLADRDLRNLVSDALANLPRPQQEAIELAYYEGLSDREIAARLNEPLSTLKTRIKLGMAKLRESLRTCWQQSDHP